MSPCRPSESIAIVADKHPSTRGTALLVEDNEEVAGVSAAYLEQLGLYGRNHASTDRMHCRRSRTESHYDLVFSDILMPGSVAGLELARFVRQHHPNIPILLTTGYSQKAQEAVREGFPILQKPYDLNSLSKAIRELRTRNAA